MRPGATSTVDPPHVGRPVVGEAVLGGVLVEQAELVVGDQLRHATSVPYARRPARRAKNAAMPDAASPPWSWPPARAPGCARSGPSRCTCCAAGRWSSTCSTPWPSSTCDRVVVVVGHRGEWVTKTLVQQAPADLQIEFVEQLDQSGTGDALAVGLTGLPDDDDEEEDVVVLPGDTPLLRPQTLAALVRAHRAEDAGATLLTAVVENPTGYGRVVHGKDGDVARVVEEADATDEEQAIDEVNTSIYCFRRSLLAPALRRLSPANAQGEYYLTDVVAVLHQRRATRCSRWSLPDSMEAAGVNDRAQLAVAEAELRDRINERWMRRGVTMWDPERTYVDAEVQLAADVSLLPGRDPAGRLHHRRRRRDRAQRRADRHRGRARAPSCAESVCTRAHDRRRGAQSGPSACSSPGAEVRRRAPSVGAALGRSAAAEAA